ncbi:MAG: site-specific integrase, partial [Candidatus Dormibacteraeota bacterium]|nr:site-specific integrase [Candidatus Dormibacteraeota bacterium]
MTVESRSRRRPNAPGRKRRPAWTDAIPGPHDPLPSRIEDYLDWLRVQRNRPPTTVRAYRQDLAKFVAFMRARASDEDLCENLDRATLRRYQLELADVLPNPRSRARALVALRRFLAYAYDQGWIAPELSRQVTVPRYVIGDPHPLPTESAPRLLRALPRETLRDRR